MSSGFLAASVGVLGDADIFCCWIQDSVEVHTLPLTVMFVQSLLIHSNSPCPHVFVLCFFCLVDWFCVFVVTWDFLEDFR